ANMGSMRAISRSASRRPGARRRRRSRSRRAGRRPDKLARQLLCSGEIAGVMNMVTIFRRALPLTLAALSAPVVAQGFQDLEMLGRRLAAALGAKFGGPGGPRTQLDRRLRLAACPQPATIEEPAMGAVTVRCVAHGWRIRVPLV